jgi:hypothetical protein
VVCSEAAVHFCLEREQYVRHTPKRPNGLHEAIGRMPCHDSCDV